MVTIIKEPTRAERQKMSDDDVLRVAIACGRPMWPSLYLELGRRNLHERFAVLELSIKRQDLN